jgi:glycine cleavage system aminomethyltransferase T
MSFEFLAPDEAAAAPGGPRPLARSQIEWAHLDAGANLREHHGWNVVADYGDPAREAEACRATVGVADASFLGKIELESDRDTVARIVSELAGGATLELGLAVRHEETWWCPITVERVLAVTQPDRTAGVREALERTASSGFASVTELTAAHGSNLVVGPLARECFARATALDMRPQSLPEAGFAPVSVARTPGMVLRSEGDRFLHLFGAGYAQYNWTVFVDSAEHLGGRAVGMDAIAASHGDASGVAAGA